ncbi:MAG TPA: signal peptide peptidase SppA [Xanthomonadales bacterium]|nr:signal peptide peptidase SppA [Xanthomonadales bacterium]
MSEARKPGLLRRIVGGLWWSLDQSRRLAANLIFLLLLVWMLAALVKDGPTLKQRTALVIAPSGALVEQFSADPASRAVSRALGEDVQEVQLRDVLRAIDAAREDERIERIFLRADGLTSAGMASLREISAALRAFRAAGKQVVAYADGYDQRQYLLAAAADEVYLHPAGALLLEGLARYRPYYREGLQDKLGVDVHLFKVGEYKSAAEPYILDAPSPEAAEADRFWMTDIWQRYLAEVAEARELSAETLAANIDRLPERLAEVGGDLAKLALAEGLVDDLKTQDQIRQLMIERGVEDEDGHTFRQVSMEDYLARIDQSNPDFGEGDRLAVVVAQGEIVFGEPPPGQVGGVSTAALIRRAREDENVRGVLLRVDSPGGGVFPSEQIRREVELTREAGKPVVVSMGDVAASGGYWISMNADTIIADPSTITGSIGIYGLWLTVPRTLEKIGVRVGGTGTTRFAGAFDPSRPLDPAVGQVIQSVIDQGYRDFIGKVADARESTPEAIDQVARGRVWSGAQAHERGLVDRLGGLAEAEAELAELTELEKGSYRLVYIEPELDPFQQFIANLGGNSRLAALFGASGLATALAPKLGQQVAADLAWLEALGQRPLGAFAHCLCEL